MPESAKSSSVDFCENKFLRNESQYIVSDNSLAHFLTTCTFPGVKELDRALVNSYFIYHL